MLALATCELLPPVFALLQQQPWLTQTFRAAYRIGLGLVTGGLCLGLGRITPLGRSLSLLGRSSLLIYWVHLELVFGPLARSLRGLDLVAWAGWAAGLVGLMTLLAGAVARAREGASWAHVSRGLMPETSAAKPL